MNDSSARVDARRATYAKQMLVSVPVRKFLRKQNFFARLRAVYFQDFRRDAMGKSLRAELRIENLSEWQDRVAVAGEKVVALIAIGKNPVGAHHDHPAFLRIAVSWKAE